MRGRFVAAGGGFPLHILNGFRRALVAVQDLYGVFHAGGCRHHGDNPLADRLFDFACREKVQRIAHSQIERILFHTDRDHVMLSGQIARQGLRHIRGNGDFRQIDKLNAQLHLKRLDQLRLCDNTVVNQHGSQTIAAGFLQLHTAFQFFLRNRSSGGQKFAKPHIRHKNAAFLSRFINFLCARTFRFLFCPGTRISFSPGVKKFMLHCISVKTILSNMFSTKKRRIMGVFLYKR